MAKRLVVLTLVLAMFVSVAGCAQQSATPKPVTPAPAKPAEPAKPAQPMHITIGTASVGGVFYPIGMAVAKIWNDNVPNVKAVAIATAGSPQNIEMKAKKEMEVSVLRSLEGYRAINGTHTYKEKMTWLKSLSGPLYQSGHQVVALKNKNIKSIYDFKGKKIAVGPVGSGGEVDARAILDAHGLNYWDRKDLTPEYVEAGQAVEMMKDGLIDGAILGLTMGAAAIQELMLTGKVVMLEIDDAAFAKMKAKEPWTQRYTIKPNLYPNQDYPVKTVCNPPVIIACREDLPEQMAYLMTKAIYENEAAMRASAGIMADFSIKEVSMDTLVPFHPGALRYFKEKGVIK